MIHGLYIIIASYPLVNQHNYGKSPCFMGKSTINGHVQYMLVYQRVYPINIPLNHYNIPLNQYKSH